jgi:hypothetical protein
MACSPPRSSSRRDRGRPTFGSRWKRADQPLLVIACLIAFSFALDTLGSCFHDP